MKDINIALLGFGTVGSGVAEAIRRNGEALSAEIGCRLHLKTVLVRNPEKYEHLDVLKDVRVTTDFAEIEEDDSVSVIVEVMGGIDPAKDYIYKCHHSG
jgi:homoserine dehydrogenase